MGRSFCADCPKRDTCVSICDALKKNLANSCRAKNSPKAQLWGDISGMERWARGKKLKIRRCW